MMPLLFVSLVITFLAIKRFQLSQSAWLALLLLVVVSELAHEWFRTFRAAERNGWKGEVRR